MNAWHIVCVYLVVAVGSAAAAAAIPEDPVGFCVVFDPISL